MPASIEPRLLRFSLFELDLRSHELRRNGRRIKLQEQPFQALQTLLERPGELVTRGELRGRIWPADTFVDFDLSLNTTIRRLRQALGDDAEAPRFIETIPRVGYRFIAPVDNGNGALQVASSEAQHVTTGGTPLRQRYLVAIASVAAIVLVVVGVLAWRATARDRAAKVADSAAQIGIRRAYQMGRFELNIWTREDLTRSLGYFDEALRADPRNAPAWAGTAEAQTLLAILGYEPIEPTMAKAKAAALKAVELDDGLAEAHVALGAILLHRWSWAEAETELRRAVALDPNSSDARQWHGYYLLGQGRLDEAVAEMRRAQQLDPNAANKKNSLAAALYYARRYDEALAIWNNATALGGNNDRRHLRMSFMLEQKGRKADSLAEFVAVPRSAGRGDVASAIERAYLSSGYDRARELFYRTDLEAARRQGSKNAEHHLRIAMDYAALGDKSHALAWLDKAVATHAVATMYLGVEPRWDPLRSDPRFVTLLRSVGLPSN